MHANIVSPPLSGTSRASRIDPSAGIWSRGFGPVPFAPKYGRAGRDGPKPFQLFLKTLGRRFISLPHARKHRAAASLRNLAREQNRPERRDLVVAVIRMPTTADVGLL